MNKTIASGTVGKEIATNQSGKVAMTSLATMTSHKDQDGNYRTKWYNLKFLGEGHVARLQKKGIGKGSRLLVEGEEVDEEYKDKNGNIVKNTTLYVTSWESIMGKSAGSSENKTESADNSKNDGFMSVPTGGSDDFLPFA